MTEVEKNVKLDSSWDDWEVSCPMYNLLNILLTNLHYLEEKWQFNNAVMFHFGDQNSSLVAKENRGHLY